MEAPTATIGEIEFGLSSPDEIIKYSVTEINTADAYDHKVPRWGGMMDPRLGAADKHTICSTCKQDLQHCPGHFGHIKLATPVFHPFFLQHTKKVLETLCTRCSRVKIPDTPEGQLMRKKIASVAFNKDRFRACWKTTKTKMACEYEHCGFETPCLRVHSGQILVGKSGSSILTPEKILEIFSRIGRPELGGREDDLHLLGFHPKYARPEWMILTVLPVPPPSVRPSMQVMASQISPDEIYTKFTEVIRTNNQIAMAKKDVLSRSLATLEEALQLHVVTYMDNESSSGFPKAIQRHGKSFKSMKARIQGKQGRVRGSLMGKRVDFSARTVITGDSSINVDEMGIPIEVAMNLTVPERVTQYNLAILQSAVHHGPFNYPGATYVTCGETGKKRYLKYAKGVLLKVGDLVDRHLINGDPVLLNRQPTLSRYSMLAVKTRVLPGKTFRLHLSQTSPLNADFDGDECCLSAPQGIEAIAELQQLMSVPDLIVSPQSNKPTMAVIQDTLLGIRRMTKRDTFITYGDIQQLIMKMPNGNFFIPPPAILKPEPLWTGKQVFSMLLPPNMTYLGTAKAHKGPQSDGSDPACLTLSDTRVLIENSELLTGIICKNSIGTSGGSIVHIIWIEEGPLGAAKFIDAVQYTITEWLDHTGFSVGVGDCIVDESTRAKISSIVVEAREKCLEINKDQSYSDAPHLREKHLMDTLTRAREASGMAAADAVALTNGFVTMTQAGSKGSPLNISQISGIVGQQCVEGTRIPFGNYGRSLPFFAPWDPRPEARGFVSKCFLEGISPTDYFFHAQGGREGLIHTAVKTASTGYLNRRLVKSMEDVAVQYDGTVRTAEGLIVQFKYGCDGLDGIAIEKQEMPLIQYSDAQIKQLSSNPSEREQLVKDRATLMSMFRTGDKFIQAPLNIERILDRASKNPSLKGTLPQPQWLRRQVDMLRTSLYPVGHEELPLMSILLRFHFATGRIKQRGLSRPMVEWALSEIKKRFRKGLVHAGEAVGCLAAQSIGEPTTQFALDSFHSSGVTNELVCTGVGRLTELLNDAKKSRTPSMTLQLLGNLKYSKEEAQKVAMQLKHVSLADISNELPMVVPVGHDEEWLDQYWLFYEGLVDKKPPLASHALRISLSKQILNQHGWTAFDVAQKMEEEYENYIICAHTPNNYEDPTIYVYFIDNEYEDAASIISYELFLNEMRVSFSETLTLSGAPEIERTTVTQVNRPQYDKKQGKFVEVPEFVVETLGINLAAAVKIKEVDPYHIYANDPKEMKTPFGIDAARECLLTEIRKVIEYDGSYVNYRHLALLCDVMCARGAIMPVTRHGINRVRNGPLRRCTFEETLDVLTEASLYNQCDGLKGISENIMVGKSIPTGTGIMDVHFNDAVYDDIQAI